MLVHSEHLLTKPVPKQAVGSHRYRIGMVVTGFPHSGNPGVGIFNLRAAQALSEFADVTVLYLRTWLPGRKLRQTSVQSGLSIVTVALPQNPLTSSLNVAIYSRLGWDGSRKLPR